MKTILNIIIMLLVAAAISGGYALIVNNTSAASGAGLDGGQPALNGTNGQMPTRPEGGPGGDHDGGASIGQGLLQVLVTLAKIAGISTLVLVAKEGLSRLSKRAPRFIASH